LYLLGLPHHFVGFWWCGGGHRSCFFCFPHHFVFPWWCGDRFWCFFFWDLFDFLLLQPLLDFFILDDKAVHQLRLDFNLPYALWVWPVLDPYHGALLLPGLEVKLLFLSIDIEADFFSSNIDLHSRSAQERSPQDEWRFFCGFHIKNHEIDRDGVPPDFQRNVFGNPRRVVD